MEIKNNIPDVIKRLEDFKAKVLNGEINFADAMFSALNTGNGLMKRRIFNLGEDAEGRPFGRYVGNKSGLTRRKFSIASDDAIDEKQRKADKNRLNRVIKGNTTGQFYTEYEKKRLSRGRQIAYKDLELEGGLRRSIEVFLDGPRAVIAIANAEEALIAKGQEAQIGRIRGEATPAVIFTLSEEEYIQVQTEGNRLIQQLISDNI